MCAPISGLTSNIRTMAGTKFTRLDALKDAIPFWGSISGGNTTVLSLFFFVLSHRNVVEDYSR